MVADNRKSSEQERILPRISTAIGGPMPGIDITDGSALQELDDLEYVERMKSFDIPAASGGEPSRSPGTASKNARKSGLANHPKASK